PDTLTSLAGRLARLDQALDEPAKQEVTKLTGGKSLSQLSRELLDSVDPDVLAATAKEGKPDYYEPSEKEIREIREIRGQQAAAPLATNPQLRQRLIALQRAAEQTIDTLSQDRLVSAGATPQSSQDAAK